MKIRSASLGCAQYLRAETRDIIFAGKSLLERPMTGEMFKAYTEQLLAPTLRRGDIVFMDNVSVHKVNGVEEAIEARGAIPF